ncbi:hybrid sensor histidine kinase/response regulator [Sessilibacter corallicola]|uniref:histidine kinase n=1 Tax=Sessilibacter corallicola TaxID=2904075 RepID=A0ABQ0A5L5_9GAMM
MGENRNFAALDWVTQEIDETLSHARDALEGWANDPNDKSKIRFCLGHIHQVHGSLQMVEFYGAALLAEELEHLAQALCDEKLQFVVEAQESLMRGILQLPLYLDFIKTHRQDQPAMILPLLNDLRAVRGENLLSESRLFNPDLRPATQLSAKRLPASIDASQFLSVLKKLQQMYQIAAASIIRGIKVKENIEYLNKVLARQYKLTSGTLNQPLWEISLALVEALSLDGVELTASVKLLLRQLNRELKLLLRSGVQGLDKKVDEELLKNLLFYVGTSKKSGRFTDRIREKYSLTSELQTSTGGGQISAAPDPAAIRSVVVALKEELRTIKINLDDCLASDSVIEVLKESYPVAQRVADTLAILGVGDIRKQMLAQVTAIDNIIQSENYHEQQLYDLAAEMIDIEGRLDALTRGVSLARNDIEQQKAQHLNMAQEVVLSESRNGLEQTKDCIIEYIASQWDKKHLDNVPKLLREIRGGLDMVPIPRAASVLGACAEYIETKLLTENHVPEWRSLDTLADAIASIEYYLEHLGSNEGQDDDEMLLAVAEDSVRNLGLDVPVQTQQEESEPEVESSIEPPIVETEFESFDSPVSDVQEPNLHSETIAPSQTPISDDQSRQEFQVDDPWRKMLAGEAPETSVLVEVNDNQSAEAVSESADTSLESVEETSDEIAESNESIDPVIEAVEQESAPSDDLIDDEIIEIFIEEAEEVSATIDAYYPRWAEDQSDQEALTEFRRGFHTLKGSGRMVGASDIGELAWAIENMLNRIIDKTISADPIQVELINRVLKLLPDLIESFKLNKPNPKPELCRQYMSWADEIASGVDPEGLLDSENDIAQKKTVTSDLALDHSSQGETDSFDVNSGFEAAAQIDTLAPEENQNFVDAIEDEYDDDSQAVLWEIFSAEARGHLETIKDYIDEMDASAPIFDTPSDPMQRALHTLKGSAHMAEVTPIAQLATPLENFVKELRSYYLSIDEDILFLIKDGVEYIEIVLDQIATNEALVIPRLDQFLARVTELREKFIGPILRQQDGSAQSKPVDPELLSIFMAEEMNLLLDAEIYLAKWRENNLSDSELEAIFQELHLLYRGASRANYSEMALLSELLEKLYQAALDQKLVLNDRFFDVLGRGHEFLLDMIDSVAAGQNLPPVSIQLRADIELLLDECNDNAPAPLVNREESFASFDDVDEPELSAEFIEPSDDIHEQNISEQGIPELNPELEESSDEAIIETAETEIQPADAQDDSWFTVGFDESSVSEVVSPSNEDSVSEQPAEETGIESDDHLYIASEDSHEAVIPDLTETVDGDDFVVILDESETEPEDQALLDSQSLSSEDLLTSTEVPDLVIEDSIPLLSDSESSETDVEIEAGNLVPELLDSIHDEDEDLPLLDIEVDLNEEEPSETSEYQLGEELIDEDELLSSNLAESDLASIGSDGSDLNNSDLDKSDLNHTDLGDFDFDNVASLTPSSSDDQDSVEIEFENEEPALLELEEEPLDSDDHLSVEEPSVSEDVAASFEPQTSDLNDVIAEIHRSSSLDQRSDTEFVQPSEVTTPTFDEPTEVSETPVLEQPVAESPVVTEPPTASEPVAEENDSLDDLDIDPDIIEIFSEESFELLEEIDASVHDWMEDWERDDCSEKLKRLLHTFKGSARLAGLMGLGEAAHEFESYLIKHDRGELDDTFFNKVNAYYELLHVSSDQVQTYIQDGSTSGMRKLFIAGELPLVEGQSQTPDVAETPVAPISNDDAVESEEVTDIEENVSETPASGEYLSAQEITHSSDGPSNVVPFAPRKTLEETPITPLKPLRSDKLTAPPVQTMMGAQIAQRGGAAQESVKVSAELLEELVNLAGETSISRARMEEQVSEIGFTIDEMEFTIERLQEQLRRLDIETEAQILFRQEQMEALEDFDPLEMDRYSQLQQLSRSLVESASDLLDLKATLSEKTRDTETLLLQQSRINTELQEGLMRSRMVPFSRLVPRLRRIIRQISSELGKRVNFELDNVEGELDRTMLERMVAPLEHMLRNAVDHGIEMPDVRVASGKQEIGTVRLSLGREGGDVILRLSDDGCGVNIARVRQKAIERGLMSEDAQLSDKDIIQFILAAGFSTAEHVTQISGRGVGMDVVNSEIKQLGGSVSIASQEGLGSEFTMRLPFTLSVNRALMVAIGDDLFAVPLNTIEGIVRVSPYELEHYYSTPDARFEYAGQQYQVKHLGGLLDENHRYQVEGRALPLPVLLVRSQEYSVALQVDNLLGSREIVVKSLGAQFSGVDGLSGATVMGDGSVVVILDLLALIRRMIAQTNALEEMRENALPPVEEKEDVVPTVIIVDDSVTVRKVTSRFLEREGFNVMTAKDGVDALRQLQDKVPDVMLLDIEMPRMDGFEVAKNIRSSTHLKDLPIIMITSRTGSKHRERALELGVNNYLGKPYQEDDLLQHIKALIGQTEIQV